jgi:hypothetical protein
MSRTWWGFRALCVTAVAVILAGVASNTADAQTNLTLTAGSSVYSSDAFCLDSGAALTNFGAGVEGSVFGGEVMFINGAWPWPCPAGGCGGGTGFNLVGFSGQGRLSQPSSYLTHGNAVLGVVKLFPVPLVQRFGLDGLLGAVDQYVRPYIGVGVQISSDGETASAGGARLLPTYSVKGRTDFVITYGAAALLPGRDTRLGLVVEYRGARTLGNEIEVETDDGRTLESDGSSLKWGQWGVGLRIRLGS